MTGSTAVRPTERHAAPIPLVDIAAQQAEIAAEVLPLVEQVLRTGAFVGGPHVAGFEQAYARFAGTRHCIGVANGTDALEIAFRTLGVGRGDEIVIPANTFIATAEAADRIGARIVLTDVDPDHLLMDAAGVAAALTPATRVVVPVHLFGQTAPVEQVREVLPSGVAVVEDGAQSQGATRFGRPAGSLGDIAATSFYPGKNLGAAGDAGAVTTDDDELARLARLIGAHGSAVKYHHEVVGFNSRLDAIQAVVLAAKLERLARWNEARRVAAARYDALLADVDGVVLPRTLPGNEHVWHLYAVRVADRDRVVAALNAGGIGAGVHYPVPVHLTPAFAHLGHRRGDFPVAEAAADTMLSLPMHGHLTAAQQERVVDVLICALSRL